MDRRRHVLECVRPRGRTGVEIGPLNRPIVLREDGHVLYADHRTQEGLREKYAGHDITGGLDAIVEVDLVLDGVPLSEALGARGPVDYIVAAHVFEHIPDGIGWLLACADALNEGGALCLLQPDKRFCFDFHRAPTSTGDLIAAHLAGPPLSAVYEYCARAHVVNPFAVWRGEPIGPVPDAVGRAREALRTARAVAAAGGEIDVHRTVFTPHSFVAVMAELAALGLTPYAFGPVLATERNDVEFLATLIKRSDLSPEERAATAPRLDPRLHHDLPRPRWTARARAVLGL